MSLINHSFGFVVAGSDGTRLMGNSTETAARSIDLAVNFQAGTTNLPMTVAWTAANTQSVYLVASTDLTIATNSPTAPNNVIHLKAGVPFQWEASAGYFPCPFTADVTVLYFTCTAASLFQGAILTN